MKWSSWRDIVGCCRVWSIAHSALRWVVTIGFSVLITVAGWTADSRQDGTWEFYAKLKSTADAIITVRIITGPWEPSDHKIEADDGNGWKVVSGRLDTEKEVKYRIDGRENIYGADGFGWPEREVKMFVVQWGDRTINVPRKHWRDYYWLLLYTVEETKKDSSIGGCWTKALIDPESGNLVIIANGGGGAGWYRAIWTIRPDGTMTDTVESVGE